jgi:hypothetical protein
VRGSTIEMAESAVSTVLSILTQRFLLLTGWVEFSHIVAAVIFFWWKQRQPKLQKITTKPLEPRVVTGKDEGCSRVNGMKVKEWNAVMGTDQLTVQERDRFLTASKGKVRSAVRSAQCYLSWREAHRAIVQKIQSELELTGDQDSDDWMVAVAVASAARGETKKTNVPTKQVARMYHINGVTLLDRCGHRMIHVTPGKMDDCSLNLKTYALAIALYIDRKLAPDSKERITLLIDVRGGVGWRNLNGAQLLPFIQHTCSLLLAMFPERLARSVVYPLPPTFEWVWKIVRRCIDAETAKDIAVLTGPAFIVSPPPSAKMAQYLDEKVIQHLEQERVATFLRPDDSKLGAIGAI